MGSNNERDTVQLRCQPARKAGIPGMGVDKVGMDIFCHLEVNIEGFQCSIGAFHGTVNIIPCNFQRPLRPWCKGRDITRGTGTVKSPHSHIYLTRQCVGQFFNMDPCPAVNMRREFAGQQINMHNKTPLPVPIRGSRSTAHKRIIRTRPFYSTPNPQ